MGAAVTNPPPEDNPPHNLVPPAERQRERLPQAPHTRRMARLRVRFSRQRRAGPPNPVPDCSTYWSAARQAIANTTPWLNYSNLMLDRSAAALGYFRFMTSNSSRRICET